MREAHGEGQKKEERCRGMSGMEELIRLLIEPNTAEELRAMLREDCWSPGVKRIFLEEIERRQQEAL